jgi:hypothetical protein
MTLRFPYRRVPTPHPVISLGGRRERPRSLISVSLAGPTNTVVRVCRLDTGADDTVFPEDVALRAGIDLTGAPVGQATGVGGGPVPVRYAQAELRISDGREHRAWTAWVGFSAGVGRPLLGYAGFLQFFDALFRGSREEVELTVNDLYPGT